ncbi:hypothetical protein THAOC_01451 [Thalassiosira oceanica]|uniref:Uncharacterized protein n=1 Tax=Thalassiosira oceanica TaxID=159749 RepID=K0TH98_THAOC|nr:hypothetical protein THAOC_01451 [Thalassiosira oceanica]|eukprot:EJK76770.1 hypothetical protein THAOC_01451 [Thalassiosira oceanica]
MIAGSTALEDARIGTSERFWSGIHTSATSMVHLRPILAIARWSSLPCFVALGFVLFGFCYLRTADARLMMPAPHTQIRWERGRVISQNVVEVPILAVSLISPWCRGCFISAASAGQTQCRGPRGGSSDRALELRASNVEQLRQGGHDARASHAVFVGRGNRAQGGQTRQRGRDPRVLSSVGSVRQRRQPTANGSNREETQTSTVVACIISIHNVERLREGPVLDLPRAPAGPPLRPARAQQPRPAKLLEPSIPRRDRPAARRRRAQLLRVQLRGRGEVEGLPAAAAGGERQRRRVGKLQHRGAEERAPRAVRRAAPEHTAAGRERDGDHGDRRVHMQQGRALVRDTEDQR